MWIIALLPFFLQALAIALDEGYFHIRRGLPKWERIGHPIDTLSVLFCLLFTLLFSYSTIHLWIYISLATFSAFLVTKDEFVHKEHCPAAEQWLHAVLFTLHPITLICMGLLWVVSEGVVLPSGLLSVFTLPFEIRLFLKGQFCMMGIFFCYQVIFWNFIWKEKSPQKE